MSSAKRLLIISNRYPVGPDDTALPFVYDFRRALENLNIEVDIVTPYYESVLHDSSFLDEHVYRFRWSDGTKVISQLPLYRPSTFLKIRNFFKAGFLSGDELLSKNKYDGLIALRAAPSGYIAYKLSKKYKVPYAVWALGSDINRRATLPLVGRVILKVLKKADALYADGYELADKVQTLTGKECDFIPSFHAIKIDREKNDEEYGKYFICVGRIEKCQGVFDLLEAFRIFIKRNPEWRLYYVGTGRAEMELKQRIQSYGLLEEVKFLGYLHRRGINRLLVHAVAAVIPSYSDSLPLTFGEAMQANVPVICSDIGDMPFLIDKYDVGYYYHVGNVKELAMSMKMMAENSSELSCNCGRVLDELDINNSAKMVKRWLDTKSETDKIKSIVNVNR
jgi:glycosyltransferase involved in cell wall biosynthesis